MVALRRGRNGAQKELLYAGDFSDTHRLNESLRRVMDACTTGGAPIVCGGP